MDSFVFDVPISDRHPYEQNISDYDDYFLRDLDAIFQQQVEVTALQTPRPENRDVNAAAEFASVSHQPMTLEPLTSSSLGVQDQTQIQLWPDEEFSFTELVDQQHYWSIDGTYNQIPVILPVPYEPLATPILIDLDTPTHENNSSKSQRRRRSPKTTSIQCTHCTSSFTSKKSHQKHLKDQHSPTKTPPIVATFPCPQCSQTFATKTSRNQHKRTSHRDAAAHAAQPNKSGTHKCDMCVRTFAYRTMLQHHRRTEHPPQQRHPCRIGFCDQVFRTAALLESHTLARHSQPSPAAEPRTDDITAAAAIVVKSDTCVQCPHAGCELTFANLMLLRRHQTLHRLRAYRCTTCQHDYHSKAVYETHVRLSHPPSAVDDVVLVADEDIDSGPQECAGCCQLFENRRVLRKHRQFCAGDRGDDDKAVAEEAERAARRRLELTGKPMAIEEVYVKQEPIDGLMEE